MPNVNADPDDDADSDDDAAVALAASSVAGLDLLRAHCRDCDNELLV